MTEIFKVQRAIAGEDALLIYNKDRTKLMQLSNNGELDKFFKDSHKIYVEGYIEKDKLHVIRKVGAKNW